MINKITDTIKKEQFISSGVIELKEGSAWRQLAGFTDLVLVSEPFVKETNPTDDGISGVKTVRQDGKASFNLRMPKSAPLIEKLFSLPVTYSLGADAPVTAELVKADLKAGDGIYEAVLFNPSGDGTKATAVTVKNEAGAITYVLDTDYTIELVNGFTAIRMITGGAILKDQTLSVDYTYKPLVSASMEAGEAQILTAKHFRFREAPDKAGSSVTQDLLEIEFPTADVVSGMEFHFLDQKGEKDEFEMPVEIENRKGETFTVKFMAR